MNMIARPGGTFVISWSQTEIDGLSGSPIAALEKGATWQWKGASVQIDGTNEVGDPFSDRDADSIRRQAAAGARRIVGRALVQEGVRTPFLDDEVTLDQGFTLTDGRLRWVATLMTTVSGSALPCTRAAMLGVSPNANCSRRLPPPISPTTTGPV